MSRIIFTLQDAPDFTAMFDTDLQPNTEGEYSVSEENALALLIYELFPQLKASHRRIKKLTIIDESGNIYETDDFDMYNGLKKKDKKNH